VTIVDTTRPAFIFCAHPDAGQFHHQLAIQIATDAVVIQVQLQLAANQARRHGVEDATHIDGATTADSCREHFIVGNALRRQGLEMVLLFRKLGWMLLIQFGNNAANEGLIVGHAGEVSAATEIERLGNTVLEMTMGRFDRVE